MRRLGKRGKSARGKRVGEIVGRDLFHSRSFEIWLGILGLVAFAVVGPLRGFFETLPGIPVVCTFILFVTPGALMTRWFLGEYFSGISLLPVAVVVSTGAFALLGVPALILQSSLPLYLWTSGAVVVLCLLAAVFVAFIGPRPAKKQEVGHEKRQETNQETNQEKRLEAESDGVDAGRGRGGLLWIPFAGLAGASAYVARGNSPGSYGDIWIYLSWIREFLGGGSLASVEPYFGNEVGLSRAKINGWLLEQAAFSRVSGVGPLDLLFKYMNPALVVVALLAFYALARVLFENEKVALFCGSLYALFFLVHLDVSTLSFGGEFFQRLIEDKMAAKFLFLPTALGFAAAFLKGGGWRYFWCFTFVCAAVVLIHPIGLAIIGISMAGFGIVYVAANLRSRQSWTKICAMGISGGAVIAIPGALVYALSGQSLSAVLADADINSGDPAVLRNMIFVVDRGRIFEFSGGAYMMHPSLILDPVIAAAFLFGIPFLVFRLRHNLAYGLAVQMLFGILLFTTLLVYVPPIATFMGENVVLPGQIWRLAWPIPLAAVLTLGWLVWEVMSRAKTWLGERWMARSLTVSTAFLPTVLVILLAVVSLPWSISGMGDIQRHAETVRSSGIYPADPIYSWLREETTSSGHDSPSVVLAPEVQSARMPAFSPEANVISRRGGLVLGRRFELEQRVSRPIEVPQGTLDLKEFYSGTSHERAVTILRRNEVDYVIVQTGSSMDRAVARIRGIESLREPSDRYDVYEVDHKEFGR